MAITVLTPVDGSEPSYKAVAFAAEFARKHDGKLVLLNVQSDDLAAAKRKVESKKVLDQAKAVAVQAGADIIEVKASAGDAAATILAQAGRVKADIIVMGRRGLGGLKGLLVGSVSSKVSSLAACTCVTVH